MWPPVTYIYTQWDFYLVTYYLCQTVYCLKVKAVFISFVHDIEYKSLIVGGI